MEARKVTAKSRAPKIITLFSEYLIRMLPTISLKISDQPPKIPTRTPISLSSEPDLAKKIGRVGIRAW
jgi:hypothetical protein